jgi:4-hydroxybenzoate polyprenyltransferase
LYGVYFSNNTAFSAAAMGFTIGLSIGSAISTYFCTYIKIYIYLIIIALSLVCYLALVLKHRNSKVEIEENNPEKVLAKDKYIGESF